MKKVTKVFSVMVASVALAAMLSGCGGDKKAAGDTIKVGGNLEMTGGSASFGISAKNGIELAFKDINAKGGVNGKKLELVVADNKSEAAEATNAMQKLVSQDKVVAVIGPNLSSATIAASAINNGSKVLDIAPMATNPNVTVDPATGKTKDYNFRACFIDPYQGAAAATYAYKNLGYKKAAVLTDVVSDYAVGLSNFFKKSYKKLGGELVADMKYSSGDQDFTAQLTELISKKPDIVFMPAYFAEGAIIMKQARELGATFVLMGGDAMDNPDTVKIAGKAAEGFMQTAFPYDMTMKDMNDQAKAFTEAWKKNFPNKDPNVNSALGYNCYNIILDALTRAGKADTEALTAALAATKNLPTALGVLSINETHDAEMPVGIIKYMDGKRKYIGDAIAE